MHESALVRSSASDAVPLVPRGWDIGPTIPLGPSPWPSWTALFHGQLHEGQPLYIHTYIQLFDVCFDSETEELLGMGKRTNKTGTAAKSPPKQSKTDPEPANESAEFYDPNETLNGETANMSTDTNDAGGAETNTDQSFFYEDKEKEGKEKEGQERRRRHPDHGHSPLDPRGQSYHNLVNDVMYDQLLIVQRSAPSHQNIRRHHKLQN